MNMRRRILAMATAAVLCMAATIPTHAVFESKMPVERLFSVAGAVLLGKVDKITADTGVVELTIGEALAGQMPEERRARVVIRAADLLSGVAEGQRLVLMPSRAEPTNVVLHLGDRWMLARQQPGPKVPLYAAAAAPSDFAHAYPGRTARLIDILGELKESKKTGLPDKTDPRVLTGGVRALAQVAPNATTAIAGDFNRDGKADLALATAGGVKVYSLQDNAWSESNATPPAGWEGKPLAGATAEIAAGGPARAAVAGPFGEKDEPAVIVVRAKGIFRESPEGEKSPLPSDELQRLSGDASKTFFPATATAGIASALAVGIDVNADGRRDVLVLSDEGGVVLVSRGYGAFFVVPRVHERLMADGKLPFAMAGTLLAAADVDGDGREDLLAVAADGRVWTVANPLPR